MSSLDRGRVWLLEDSALEAEMARRALAPTQDVELFADGSTVLERASLDRLPDVVVLDTQLPGISGLEVCRVVRATHDPMQLPILVLTGQSRKEDVVEALALGANDYVIKPYDVAELVARVGTLVRTSRLQQAQARRARQLALAADVGAALTEGRTVSEIAERCASVLASHTGALRVELWASGAGGLTRVAATPEGAPEVPEALVREAAARRQVVVEEGAPPSASSAPAGGSVAVVPLVLSGEVIGVLAVRTPRSPGADAPGAETVADLLALGLARAQSERERMVLLERERNTRAEAEAANRSKDEFLAMVSHELRTPLNAITGWTSMLLSGKLDPSRVRRALETIDRNARAQAQLIDDLLDISRIISGRLRLNVGTVDVEAVVEIALESVRLAAEGKGVALDARIDASVGVLAGDADRLQQVVWNLLSNAIKFTPSGGRVVLDARRDGSNITISVEDTGQGISAEFLPYVFERFKQADGSPTRAKGGLGLGLSIVRHIVELHGGTISADSGGAGKGARFVIELPVRAQVRSDASRAVSWEEGGRRALDRPRDVEGMRVLVVDDEPDARDLIRALLESCNIVVTTASNAAEAFDVVRSTDLDLVLSDIAMPQEDGLSLIKRVRALPRDEGGRVPAVALTAYARLEDRTRALLAGFNGHVAKPVEPAELLAVLSSFASAR